MQPYILTTLELADDDLKRLDQQTRLYWIRVYRLVNEAGASLDLAIKAVQEAEHIQEQNHVQPRHTARSGV